MRHRIAPMTITPAQRFATGVIATMIAADGTTHTLHFTGEGSDAVRACAAYCDAHAYRVVTLSSPLTIYRDLQGWRRNDTPTNRRRVASTEKVDDKLQLPEPFMLGLIGRRDLLA